MTTITIANLVPRVRDWLQDYPAEDYATNGETSGSTTLRLNTASMWAQGNVIEDRSTQEQMLIRSADPQSSPVTVKRAHNDTTAQTIGANDVLLKDPRFPGSNITEALTRLVDNGLNWPYAWKAVTVSVAPDSSKVWYDVGSGALGLISAVQLSAAPVQQVTYGMRGSGYPVSFQTGLPASLVASGAGITFPNGLYHVTNTIYVTYAAALTTADITDGLMSDCLVWGACERLQAMREVPRTGQDVTMGDASVQPGAQQRNAGYFHAKFVQARRELKTFLNSTIPVM